MNPKFQVLGQRTEEGRGDGGGTPDTASPASAAPTVFDRSLSSSFLCPRGMLHRRSRRGRSTARWEGRLRRRRRRSWSCAASTWARSSSGRRSWETTPPLPPITTRRRWWRRRRPSRREGSSSASAPSSGCRRRRWWRRGGRRRKASEMEIAVLATFAIRPGGSSSSRKRRRWTWRSGLPTCRLRCRSMRSGAPARRWHPCLSSRASGSPSPSKRHAPVPRCLLSHIEVVDLLELFISLS